MGPRVTHVWPVKLYLHQVPLCKQKKLPDCFFFNRPLSSRKILFPENLSPFSTNEAYELYHQHQEVRIMTTKRHGCTEVVQVTASGNAGSVCWICYRRLVKIVRGASGHFSTLRLTPLHQSWVGFFSVLSGPFVDIDRHQCSVNFLETIFLSSWHLSSFLAAAVKK